MTKQMHFYRIKTYYITTNQVSGVIIRHICLSFLTDKVLKGFLERFVKCNDIN